jgi:NADH:ubiquinone oxidoreductase subunit 3 (subunit A)
MIYWIGGKISPKSKGGNNGKTAPYACGEDMPIEESRINLERFFVFAVYFLVFDVVAFLLATSFSAPWYLPTIYSLVTLLAVGMLIALRRAK